MWHPPVRIIDVINVSGHRLSTAEIESALIQHHGVAETAVIAAEDELTGQAVYAFVTLKPYGLIPYFCQYVPLILTVLCF
jgi:acyl-coenzyme A synthetase/AMP-(fatty) acid ligase